MPPKKTTTKAAPAKAAPAKAAAPTKAAPTKAAPTKAAPAKGGKTAAPVKGSKAPAKKIVKKQDKSKKKKIVKKSWKSLHKHLFEKTPRDYRTGRNIPPKRDLTHFVRWPRYVRLQRQRAILKKRLKVPPAINHLAKTLEPNQAANLFRMLAHYRPESAEQKKARLLAKAKQEAKGQEADPSKKPRVLKFGLNHVTQLIESKKAKLVVIAHDVDPVELVVWLPALCRRMDVPYVIVKGKARLGHLVHLKTAACVALADIKKEHTNTLEQFIANTRPMYNDSVADRKKWGGGILGTKAQAALKRKEKAKAKELAAKK